MGCRATKHRLRQCRGWEPSMHGLINLLNDIKIRNKLLLAFLMVTLLPVLLVGGYLTIQMRSMAFHNALEQASVNVERV